MTTVVPFMDDAEHRGPDALPGRLLNVMAELTDVIRDENAIMAEGMPASVVETLGRKLDLSDLYEELWEQMSGSLSARIAVDPDFAQELRAAVIELRDVTQENLCRLDAALKASKTRVEAVMSAIRTDLRSDAVYDANGDIPIDAKFPGYGTNFRI